ncbi:MAG: bifunctional demethylmenaquinone methyltransferase/2-methoxy-6-polyprenyl-1,4-benzoquinol methylase UbiE [Verrucomicrobia bacterium]|nr:bifunctional demethylmenaquinone methyltransferase/2-methoxy-6-polyprenyl-1,4-benzoquinol methylase UbiE [Verrucomicrobiota bacterium]
MTKIQEHSRENIHKMFDQISPTYDLANRVMTFNLDQIWRRKMVRMLPEGKDLFVLDCATGTADQLICMMENTKRVKRAIGIDLAAEMVAIGEKKVQGKPYADALSFQIASALELPFEENTFDCVTISFGIRNVTDVKKALAEFYRVLKPGGRVLILEGTVPKMRWLRAIHLFYLRNFLPRIGQMISKNNYAYRYLNETIETFPSGEAFCSIMRDVGFGDAKANLQTGGVATIYSGNK